nr:TPA_asm: M73 uORF RNA *1 [Murid betaherpesvirus 1]DBA07822.1 TPA_asm: M73 uORF RNA *1 [Murid betaherpesvirus 1]
MRPRSNSRTTR